MDDMVSLVASDRMVCSESTMLNFQFNLIDRPNVLEM